VSRRIRDERCRAATRALNSTSRKSRFNRVALALVAAATLALPASALGAAKGLETDTSWGVSSSVQTQDATALTDLGATWTRITVSWRDAQPSRGSLSSSYFSMLDNSVSLARARGVQVLFDVYKAPQWASSQSDEAYPPQNPGDFAAFLTQLSQRYAGKIAAYEIWNEENLGRFWGNNPNAGAYAQMLKVAYPAVKAGDANAKVVFGGMSTNDWPYLESVYAAAPDIGQYFDVMATHPYDPPHSPDFVYYDGGRISKYAFAGYRSVRDVMASHGDNKPIWFTELGWATTSQPGWGVSAQQQADYTKLAYACMQQDPYVQVAVLYELRNNYWANDADNWEDQLGLVTTNWTHKPAYDAFKSVDPNAGGCTYHDSSGAPVSSSSQAPGSAQQPQAAGTAAAPTASSSATSTVNPKLALHVKTAGAHSSGTSKGVRSGVRFTVFGKVENAHGGSVVLTFQRRVHGKWHNAKTLRVKVASDGAFSTKQLKALAKGGWRVRGEYSTKAKSSFVYFKT
jgi:hypothetical protein